VVYRIVPYAPEKQEVNQENRYYWFLKTLKSDSIDGSGQILFYSRSNILSEAPNLS
jgi:hypothetical protein